MSEKLILSSGSLGYSVYDVETGEVTLAHSRGKLSFKNGSLLIGDEVLIDSEGFISQVLARRNTLSRPRLANADIIYVIISAAEPEFSSFLLDKFLTLVNFSEIRARIVITKCDLLSSECLLRLEDRMRFYLSEGYEVFYISRDDELSLEELRSSLIGYRVAFVGQTGVGKSTLLNRLCTDFNRKVDLLYVSSGRGRHTTKEVVMLPFNSGFLYDTPGFSQLELRDISPDDLSICFPGYERFYGRCQFSDCLHLPSSRGCLVHESIENHELSEDSYRNYCKIYEEIKDNCSWKKR